MFRHYAASLRSNLTDRSTRRTGRARIVEPDYAGAVREEILEYIQNQLMLCAAALATDPDLKDAREYLPYTDCTTRLENEIDEMEKVLKPLDGFIIPGGNILVSYCHITRCVCRRAERTVLKLNQSEKTPDIIYKFLNRLADYLFVLSRKISFDLDIEEVKWHA